ncbi:MAG: acetoacetate--CoA ligase [Hydrogenibacillus schlegelii]|nr:acetoacetate--CoA ligase [Hydrogenibacillus schlegelii]
MTVREGTLLWTPPAERVEASTLRRYMRWLKETRGIEFDDYFALWRWSVEDLEAFWASVWEFFAIRAHRPYRSVLSSRTMPGARWFEGAELNYAEHAFRHARDEAPAVLAKTEGLPLETLSWEELKRAVARARAGLERLGVRRGDRVAAVAPNGPEALIAFLATASLGAVWSSSSPDFGAEGILDRFGQIEPKVLFFVPAYRYGGRRHDRRDILRALRHALPSLEATILLPVRLGEADDGALPDAARREALASGGTGDVYLWHDWLRLGGDDPPLRFDPVPFEHPLWILFSSGTTGLPKPIVQSHGGILLEHLKALALHLDVKPGDRFFWYTTTGWMMWNFLIGGLLVGATVLLYDGSPAVPDLGALWRFAEETRMTVFGTSAPYLMALQKNGFVPRERFDLSALKTIGSTGAPLPPEGFAWVYAAIKDDVWLASVSGGTDVCTAFLGGVPLLPVHAGELQGPALGAAVAAFDEAGRSVVGEVGELVLTAPMPSMPVFFWNDPDGRRYRESYFDVYPGVWRHGDWVKITERGSAVITGRSDATINRQGVRMGTSDFYRVVEALPDVADSLVIDLSRPDGTPELVLFVVPAEGAAVDPSLEEKIRQEIRRRLSPRHVPDRIVVAPGVPRTLNGKKMEVPVKKLFLGVPPERAVNPGSMQNPEILSFYIETAAAWRRKKLD